MFLLIKQQATSIYSTYEHRASSVLNDDEVQVHGLYTAKKCDNAFETNGKNSIADRRTHTHTRRMLAKCVTIKRNAGYLMKSKQAHTNLMIF